MLTLAAQSLWKPSARTNARLLLHQLTLFHVYNSHFCLCDSDSITSILTAAEIKIARRPYVEGRMEP